MGLVKRITDRVGGGRRRATRNDGTAYQEHLMNWHHFVAACEAYQNVFAQVRPLVDEMKMVFPYGVGPNGARKDLRETPELSVLADPNREMGWAEFADLMFTTWLTEDELNIHVWRNKRGRVYGYTILPQNCRHRNPATGENEYKVMTPEGLMTYTDDEVITLRYSRSPQDYDKGVSPASAVFLWTQVDDFLSQFQKSFFQNGAVPAYITYIRASTRERYEKTKREMEEKLSGPENKNRTLFIWRQQLDDGSTADGVEVKTIQGHNAQLAIKDLTNIINDRVNKAFGVSNFILGDDSSAKYDNAELSDNQFIKRRVYPALVSFWGQIQHGLDRIVDGLGYAIQFDLDIPELTDRAKTIAETAKINAETLRGLIEAGARPSAVVAALGLPDNWNYVANGIYQARSQAQVLPALINTKQLASDVSSTAKDKNHVHNCERVHLHDEYSYQPVWQPDEIVEKKIYDALMALAQEIVDQNPNLDLETVQEIIFDLLREEADKGANEGAGRIQGLLYGKGDEDAAAEIKAVLENDGYHLSEEFNARLRERTNTLVNNFTGDTQKVVRETLNSTTGLSATEIKNQLQEVMPRWRAATIARNEVVHAFRSGTLENDKWLAREYGFQMKLVWHARHDGKTCDICAAMDGEETILGKAFSDSVVVKAGTTLINGKEIEEDTTFDWEHTQWNNNGEEPDAHVNCRCYFTEEIV